MQKIGPIGVIVPNYNQGHLIHKLIRSIELSSVRPKEVLICDDASTDDSLEKIKQLVRESSLNIRLIESGRNAGLFPMLNRVIKEFGAEYISIKSADDYYAPDFFEEMAGLIQTYPYAGLYLADVLYFGENSSGMVLEKVGMPEGFVSAHRVKRLWRFDWQIPSFSLVYRRACLDDKEPFFSDLKGFADVWANVKIAANYGLCYVSKPLTCAFLSSESYGNHSKKEPNFTEKVIQRLQAEIEVMTHDFKIFLLESGYLSRLNLELSGEYLQARRTTNLGPIGESQINPEPLKNWESLEGVYGVIRRRLQSLVAGYFKEIEIGEDSTIVFWGDGEHTRYLIEIWTAMCLPRNYMIYSALKREIYRTRDRKKISSVDKVECPVDLLFLSSKSYETEMYGCLSRNFTSVRRVVGFWTVATS